MRTVLRFCAPVSIYPDATITEDLIDDDGAKLARVALNAGLAPALALAMTQRGVSDLLAPTVRDNLHAAAVLNAHRNARLDRQLVALHELLRPAQIEPLLIKGAAIRASGLYASPAWRQLTDLDLLLRETDLPVAIQVLEGAGYRTAETMPAAPRFVAALRPSNHQCLPLAHPDHPAPVELHHCFATGRQIRSLETMALFDTAQTNAAGQRFPRNDRMLLMALMHHLRYGMWNGSGVFAPRDIVDIMHLVSSSPQLRDVLGTTAVDRRVFRAARLADHLFDDWLGLGRLLGTAANTRSRLDFSLWMQFETRPWIMQTGNALRPGLWPYRIAMALTSPEWRRHAHDRLKG